MNSGSGKLREEFDEITRNKMEGVEVTMESPRLWRFNIKAERNCTGFLTIPAEYPNIPPAITFNDDQMAEGFYKFFKNQPWNPACNLRSVLASVLNYVSFSTTSLSARKTRKGEAKEETAAGRDREGIDVQSEEKLRHTEEEMEAPQEGSLVIRARSNLTLEVKANKELFVPATKRLTALVGDPVSLPNSESASARNSCQLKENSHQRNSANSVQIEVNLENEEQIEAPEVVNNVEDRKEPEEAKNEATEENQSSDQPQLLGQWWYEHRISALRGCTEQLSKLQEDKTVTCIFKGITCMKTYYKMLLLKVAYSPAFIIAYLLVGICCFVCSVVVLFYILIKEDPNGVYSIIIIGNFISSLFLIFTSISFIRHISKPVLKELSIFTIAIEVSARLVYDITGIFVAVYYMLDKELTACGTVFLVLFAGYLCLWYKLEGVRLVIGVVEFFGKVLDEICSHTCCKPWKGVKAKTLTYDSTIQSPKCIICQVEFINQDKLIGLSCHQTHVFHQDCLLEWAKYKNECPCCKLLVDKESHPSLLAIQSNPNIQ
eukprot:TRINITY_DN7425_c0_g1_i1.p1 TRINITY_DN7425_c0_g1~~TRINITY_DN7425_c0_g1_i1.p1  ORF type:complete len:546 (-),score=110.47 TRINITY_DN7425_c0_g1_i1:132-1769(-)